MLKYVFMVGVLALLALVVVPLIAAETCFYKSDREEGLNRICFYDCVSGTYAMTIKSHQICPVTIKR